MPLAGVEGVQDHLNNNPLQGLTGKTSTLETKGEIATKSNPYADLELSLYDGRDRIGMVIQRAGCVDAFDVHGVHIGSFKKIRRAVSAVNALLPCTCVGDTSARRDNSGGG